LGGEASCEVDGVSAVFGDAFDSVETSLVEESAEHCPGWEPDAGAALVERTRRIARDGRHRLVAEVVAGVDAEE